MFNTIYVIGTEDGTKVLQTSITFPYVHIEFNLVEVAKVQNGEYILNRNTAHKIKEQAQRKYNYPLKIHEFTLKV